MDNGVFHHLLHIILLIPPDRYFFAIIKLLKFNIWISFKKGLGEFEHFCQCLAIRFGRVQDYRFAKRFLIAQGIINFHGVILTRTDHVSQHGLNGPAAVIFSIRINNVHEPGF